MANQVHPETINTPMCELLKIQYPVMVAGMAGVTGPELVASASNAGSIGVIGAVGLGAEGLDVQIKAVKKLLDRSDLPFAVDLLLPKTGDGAKSTNKDYTGGQLEQLLDIVISNKVPVFVCAVGVPPKWASDKLHEHGIVVMNMVGDPKHCVKALEAGCDMICAQGTEGGGHTGEIATMPLIPQCVEIVKGRKNFFGMDVPIVAAGGIYNGAGLAAALSLGASGCWSGTAFLVAEETNIEKGYQDKIIQSTSADTVVQKYYSGRTMRVIKNQWVQGWMEKNDQAEEIFKMGVYPSMMDLGEDILKAEHVNGMLMFPDGMPVDRKAQSDTYDPNFACMMAGQCIGGLKAVRPLREILKEMVSGAIDTLRKQSALISKL